MEEEGSEVDRFTNSTGGTEIKGILFGDFITP